MDEEKTKVLIVAEKPTIAKAIRDKLKYGSVRPPSRGQNPGAFEFYGDFKVPETGEEIEVWYKVASTCGHLYEHVYADDHLKRGQRKSRENAELALHADIEKSEIEKCQQEPTRNGRVVRRHKKRDSETNRRDIHQTLERLANGCDYLVLFLDCDAEGEDICFEVIDLLQDQLKQPPSGNVDDVIYRAHFSTVSDIARAMQNLGKPNRNLSEAVQAKRLMDLRCGRSMSELLTAGVRESADEAWEVPSLHYGPCITPVLGMVVRRYKEMLEHKAVRRWRVTFRLRRGPITFKEVGRYVQAEVSEEERCEQLEAMDTVTLMIAASEKLKLSPKQCMDSAQRLYGNGFISYPRTDAIAYPPNFDFQRTTDAISAAHRAEFAGLDKCSEEAIRELNETIRERIYQATRNPDETLHQCSKPASGFKRLFAHPPVTPVTPYRDLNRDAGLEELYKLVAKHHLACISGPLKYDERTIKVAIAGELYEASYAKVSAAGYTRYMPWKKPFEDAERFHHAVPEAYRVSEFRVEEFKTPARGLLTVPELLQAMGDHSIGTAGSIANHIAKLTNDYYYLKMTGQALIPSVTSIRLVEFLERCAPALASPQFRADMHYDISRVADGIEDKDELVRRFVDKFKENYRRVEAGLLTATKDVYRGMSRTRQLSIA